MNVPREASAALSWTPALALGVPEIDAQHRELFARLDRLAASLAAPRVEQEALDALVFLGEYVEVHFAAEEALMARARYPDAGGHAREHAAFVSTFKRLRSQFARGGASGDLGEAIRDEVRAWLVAHVCGTDGALATFLRAGAPSAGGGGERGA